MKKFTKILALALVTVVAALALVACGPNKDPSKAAQKLKDNGYAVTYTNGDNIAGTTALAVVEGVLGCERGSLTAIVSGTKVNEGGNADTITILYFKDKGTAKSVWEKAESYLKSEGEKETESELKVEQSGKMIYAATEAAIKATK